jgi:SNF2 family DNA or RNA helicase
MDRLKSFAYDQLIGGELPKYQIDDLERVWRTPKIAICNPPGTGKTILTAALLARIEDAGGIPKEGTGRALIVTQAGLVQQIADEVRRLVPCLAVMAHTSTSIKSKATAAADPTPVEIVSFDTLKINVELMTSKDFGVVVFDEASDLKGGGPRYEAALAVTAAATRILVMTGTPYENNPVELFHVLKVLRIPGVPPEFEEWGARFVNFDSNDRPRDLKRDHLDELHAMIDPYVVRRSLEECELPIPGIVRRVEYVGLLSAQRSAYERADKISNPLIRGQRLGKACNHIGSQSAKVDYAMAWLVADPTRRALVRAIDLSVLDLLASRLEVAKIPYVRLEGGTSRADRTYLAAQFRDDPTIRVCLGSKVLERGLNLQVVDTLLSLGSSWTAAREEQAEGRIRRIGSPFDVVTHITVFTDTEYERRKLQKVEGKASDAAAALNSEPSLPKPRAPVAVTRMPVESLVSTVGGDDFERRFQDHMLMAHMGLCDVSDAF